MIKSKKITFGLASIFLICLGAYIGVLSFPAIKEEFTEGDYLLPLLINLVGAFFGAICGAGLTWQITMDMKEEEDKRKEEEEERQDNAVWYGVREDLTTNYILAKEWLDQIERENPKIEKGHFNLETLVPFHASFFDAIKYRIPKELKDNTNLLHSIRKVRNELIKLNSITQSRETHKLSFGVDKEQLLGYNKMIKRKVELVIAALEENEADLLLKNEDHEKEVEKL